jgi:hypothetical protein
VIELLSFCQQARLKELCLHFGLKRRAMEKEAVSLVLLQKRIKKLEDLENG